MKKNRSIAFLLTVLLISLLCVGCASSSEKSDSDGRFSVVTSNFAAYDFARQICGDKAEVTMLLKPGSESHTYDPTPADIISIDKCSIFICSGGESDTWVDKILSSINTNGKEIIKMVDYVPLYAEAPVGVETHDHSHEDLEEEEEWDEHVWMSLENAEAISGQICEACKRVDSSETQYYESNLNTFTDSCDSLIERFRSTVESGKRRSVVFADRFPARYFVEEFGLDYKAAFPGCSESTEASSATVGYIIDSVREGEYPYIFTTELSSGKLAASVSAETGAQILTFYSCHNVSAQDFEDGVTFFDLMERNLESLGKALN